MLNKLSNGQIATVSQINAYIKTLVDRDGVLNNIWVRGEISNFKLHYSGHMYLSLKDEASLIRAVMFKNANMRLNFKPYDGMNVLVRGRVSVFERDGQYQFYIDEMVPDGMGRLYAAFEQLKNKLASEGIFDDNRKKTIPKYPKTVGVVTSATGAAVRDIINVITRRNSKVKICVYPAKVQGEGAAEEIAQAIKYFNREKNADVLIVGRGGGSIEDLWAFNEEVVARAVYESEIPVISAVGHETDFTICDFAADLRAPTPSAAAELAVVPLENLKKQINDYRQRMQNGMSNLLNIKKQKLKAAFSASVQAGFKRRIENARLSTDYTLNRIINAMEGRLKTDKEHFSKLTLQLDALSPLKVLGRGYSVTTDSGGNVVSDAKSVSPGDNVSVRLLKGSIECTVISRKE